ncbi:MAG: glucose-6-phosphate dehydrogenase, partial [Bacteroidales bacterium]
MKGPDNQIIVIFGGRGDLAMRKIVPALYALHIQGLMPEGYAVLATGRNKITDEAYRKEIHNALKEAASGKEMGDPSDFVSSFYYTSLDPSVAGDYNSLSDKL